LLRPGAPLARPQLECAGYRQAGSRIDPQRTLCTCAPPDLCRSTAGPAWHRHFCRQMARVAGLLIVVAFVRKLMIEERFMDDQFGEAYARYRAEVPALIPFVV